MFDIHYSYDVLGRKISRIAGVSPATVEHYIYNGNQIVADLNGSGNLLRTYVWGTGIDNLLSFTDHTTTNTYYTIKDHQNTVIALTDESDAVVESYEYNAYGNTKVFSATGTELTASAYGNRYMFQGREYDSATGLYYFRARWYNPASGRWLSKDPIGISGGLNLYVFCGSNPVNYVDPEGKEPSYMRPSGLGTSFLVDQMADTYDRLQHRFHAPEIRFDTIFFDGHKVDNYHIWNNRIYRGDDINYFGIGMYNAHSGDTTLVGMYLKIAAWKRVMYGETPNYDVLLWASIGFYSYQGIELAREVGVCK